MNWFRSRIQSGARLALFALAVQMVLSFGHMHRDDLGLPPLPASDQTQIAFDAARAQAKQSADRNQQPARGDYCPICDSMALIATAVPSLPPVLIVPAPIRQIWPDPAHLTRAPTRLALSFQARAPPLP
jgi:hypothetical protein